MSNLPSASTAGVATTVTPTMVTTATTPTPPTPKSAVNPATTNSPSAMAATSSSGAVGNSHTTSTDMTRVVKILKQNEPLVHILDISLRLLNRFRLGHMNFACGFDRYSPVRIKFNNTFPSISQELLKVTKDVI